MLGWGPAALGQLDVHVAQDGAQLVAGVPASRPSPPPLPLAPPSAPSAARSLTAWTTPSWIIFLRFSAE